MSSTLPSRRSLKTKILFVTLAILLLGIWSLAFYVSHMLRKDMEILLGEQQFSTVSMVATQINRELDERLKTLEKVARLSAVNVGKNPDALQALLEQRWDVHAMFNGGSYITRADGLAIADFPVSAGRRGVNYSDREYVAVPLREGRSIIGTPVIGKKAQAPVIVMGVPIRNAQHQVIGVVTGVINLGEPNFFDQITASRHGRTGGFLLVVPKQRVIATASEKARIMERLPAPGGNAVVDRFIGGYEGSQVGVNPRGVHVLASAKGVPVTEGWYATVLMPTDEAFAPIGEMQQRMLLAALALTLLIGLWIRWALNRQLSPLLRTAKALAAMTDASQPLHALPIARDDEIGELVGGFNRLLQALSQRESALVESESNLAITLQSIGDAVIATDLEGRVVRMNPTAERLTGWSLDEARGRPLSEVFRIINAENRLAVENPVQQVMALGEVVGLANHTLLLARNGQEVQISDSAAPIRNDSDVIVGVVLVFSDVTRQYQMEKSLREGHETLRSILEASQDGYWRIDTQARLLDVNPAYCQQSGYTREELLEMRISDLEAKMSGEEIAEHIQAIIRVGHHQFDTLHRRKDGSIWHVEVSTTYRAAHGGEIFVFSRDITERKLAEEALRKSEASFRDLFENNASVLLLADPATGEIVDANVAAANYYGYSRKQLMSMNISAINTMLPEHIAEERQRVLRGERKTFYFSHRLASGELRDVEAHLTPVSSGGRFLLFSIIHDITDRKLAEEKLYLAASVFSHAREAIMITDTDGTIIDVNDSFSRITGYSHEEIVGKNPRLLKSGRQERDFYAAMWHDLREKGHWYGEVWDRRKNGDIFATMQTISTVCDSQGQPRQFVSLFSDITALKEHEKKLEHIAHYDVLTTLPNRVLLADRLHQAMAQADRRSQYLAVAYLDLDGFKLVNDHHGHETGDQLLIALAGRMKQTLREGDTLARLGGDEFIAVLLDLGDVAASTPTLNRLLAAAAEPVLLGGKEFQVSASLGVTFYPQAEAVDADLLLRQSDQAMYQAKLSGKNRYHFFDTEHDRNVRGHHESIEHIRNALSAREFVLHYQPKVNMRTGAVIGAEALIRWQHPDRGLLSPGIFLPVIENHHLAIEIGEWVIDTALTQIELWRAAGLDLPVSVNIGARQLLQIEFVGRLREILLAHPSIRPGDLELEVLETSALEDMDRVSLAIEECRELGVGFALDDFGTGYSSLTYLKRLSVNQLKIDQSFVHDMLDDPDDLSILGGVLSLATAFRRQVIAEGVETIAHGTMLLQLGCELAQGYGIARPMPGADLPAWVISWRPDVAWSNLPPLSRDDLPVLFAIVEHRAWINAVDDFLKGERESLPLVHHQCRFNAWLAHEGQALHAEQPAFLAIEPLHRRAHELAAELCELKVEGEKKRALSRLHELHDLRENLLEQLQLLVRASH
ncbi:MAG: PAS domain S-box protein [Betaproteobacteria bacterium]